MRWLWILLISVSLPGQAAEILVVAPPIFHPALEAWTLHRQGQGRSVAVLTPAGNAQAIRKQIHNAVIVGDTKFVLLVGDADRDAHGIPAIGPAVLPTCYLPARVNIHWGPERDIASDNPYGDLDDDGLPELAVGRIPADSADELRTILAKVMTYETSNDFGTWRRQINFVGCPGNFGPMIDSLLEQASRKITTQGIPPSYNTKATYGHWRSPYCPDPRRFRDETVGQLNGGSLFWVYIGHGHCQVVDRLRTPDQKQYPIFSMRDVPALTCPSGHPIAIFLACYTGAFDFPVDSLSEEMLASPGGPIAIYSSTRVTMPYAMTVMGGEMMNEYFAHRAKNLGMLVQQAKRQMVERDRTDPNAKSMDTLALMANKLSPDLRAERWEHVQMYHLFGDPSMLLPQAQTVTIEAIEPVSSGQKLLVKGQCPIAGRARIELVPPRDKLPIKPDARPRFEPTEEIYSTLHSTYQRANDVVLASQTIELAKDSFSVSLDPPANFAGRGFVRVYVEGDRDFALGSRDCEVRPSDAK
jgi:hypothetical protein